MTRLTIDAILQYANAIIPFSLSPEQALNRACSLYDTLAMPCDDKLVFTVDVGDDEFELILSNTNQWILLSYNPNIKTWHLTIHGPRGKEYVRAIQAETMFDAWQTLGIPDGKYCPNIPRTMIAPCGDWYVFDLES